MVNPFSLTSGFVLVGLLFASTSRLAAEDDKTAVNFEIVDRMAGSHASFSPRGTYLAYISSANQLMIARQTSEKAIDQQELRGLFRDLDSDSFQTRDDAALLGGCALRARARAHPPGRPRRHRRPAAHLRRGCDRSGLRRRPAPGSGGRPLGGAYRPGCGRHPHLRSGRRS